MNVAQSPTEKALSVINYTKEDKTKYAGKRFESAYHTVKLGEEIFTGQRKNYKRIENIEKKFDFTDKVMLDIGCNAGGLLYALSEKIEYGVGIDVRPKCINAANIIKDRNSIRNLNFYIFNLDTEDMARIPDFLLRDHIDVCSFCAVAMWVKKWKEAILFCKEIAPYLIFESNGRRPFQKRQIQFVKENFSTVQQIDNEKDNTHRSIFLCEK